MTPGERAEASRRITENRYRRALSRVMGDIRRAVRGLTDPDAIVRAVEAYANSKAFDDLVSLSVERMITAQKVAMRATWREAAAASTQGRKIYELMRKELLGTMTGARMDAIVTQNSSLIKTVPGDVARRLSSFAKEMALKGNRPEETAKRMQAVLPHLTNVQIARIARTETAKAQSALLEARCAEIGVTMYQWYTCKDGSVRRSHALMQGVYCLWSDPPDPEALAGEKSSGHAYHPGGIYNCRCIALPVVAVQDIHFPARVYKGGKIHSVGNMKALKKLIPDIGTTI